MVAGGRDQATPPPSDLLAQARDLKARCYAAWHADPSDARAAAAALHALADEAERATPDESTVGEIRALAAWCAAVVALTEGRLEEALADLDAAHAAFTALGLAADAAQTRVPRVMALALLGRFDDALACAEAAREALLALGDTGSAAKVVLNTGSLCMQQDRYANAAVLYRRAGVLFARVGDLEHSVLADVGHADALSYLGDLDSAEALYRRAAQRAQAHALPVIGSSVLQALAELALARGRFREALQGLEAASHQFEQLALPLQRAEAEKVLADTYAELRLLPEAQALYDHVLAALDAQPGSATRPWVWLQRARLAAVRGDRHGARAALVAAGQGMESVDSDAGRAAVALAQAEMALAENRPSVARDAAAGAAGRLQALGLPTARAELVRAEAEAATGDAAAAQARLESLVALDAAAPPVVARACALLGALHARAGRGDAARTAYAQAVALAEAVRAELPSDDLRRGWLSGQADAYEGLLRMALAACDSSSLSAVDADAQHRVATALAASERLRARTLRERLGRPREVRVAGDGQLEAERLRLDWLTRRLNRFVSDAESDQAPAPLIDERRRLERRVLERARRARIAAPGRGASAVEGQSFVGNESMPRLAEMYTALGAGRALVAYGVLDDELFAFVLADGRLTLQRALASWSEVQRLARTLRGLINTMRLGTALPQRHGPLLAEREQRCLSSLYAAVWQPLAHRLGGASAVFVVPCGGLRALPFAALLNAAGPLGAHIAFTMLASVDALLRPRTSALPAGVVALGDTRRLPAAAAELRRIGTAWPQAVLLDGDAATRAALQRHASAAGVLHLACHGEFRDDSPLFSALHLADGALTAMDVEQLVLPSGAFVVLGACEAALADDALDDEAIGLVRAFLVAGASHVLGALWSIDDAATANWMGALHCALAAGATVPAAVHAVQRAWIADGAPAAQWAPFVLHGG